ncbi:polysaccharide biosynthesis/export family protein [Stagnihabitans tardus]|uniref:Polysaccharide export protein n=1 Tax=Stagnihabitans tardus TaxID=2699202 RepID=A0AAE4YAT2_9RHOB|nr:polysaccharide biosynthesis/export family protein [Stagnihabitans tardus]NBZ86849.1 polysaccharide export protein [Stagnihabitans tardus]
MPFISGPKGRVLASILLTLPLWACSPPQDVANVQQVVAGSEDESADFAVQPVDALTLPMVQGWPSSHPDSHHGWIGSGGGTSDQVIAGGDLLNLAVFAGNESALLADPIQLPNLKVSSKGTVFLPYIDEVEVAGMTADAARSRIQEKLTAIIPDVQVQLTHAAGTKNSVEVVAGMPRNGSYPLTSGDTTVTAIIAAAGGLPETMNNPQVNLQRGGRLYRVGAKTILENPGLDTVLRGGDRIYVTPDDRYFLSLGAAGKEALVDFPKDEVTTLDAMSLIGGVDQNTANPKGILVLRNYPASAVAANPDRGPSKQKVVFAFDLTSADGLFAAGQFKIEDRDLVLVTQSPLVNTRTILGFFTGFISAGRTTATAVN